MSYAINTDMLMSRDWIHGHMLSFTKSYAPSIDIMTMRDATSTLANTRDTNRRVITETGIRLTDTE